MASRKLVERSEPPENAIQHGKRARPVSDMYVAAVRDAYRDHNGEWVRIRRDHPSLKNAQSTASCMKRGFLRVDPAAGEEFVDVEGKNGAIRKWLKLPYTIVDAKAGAEDGKYYVWMVVR